MPTVTKAQARVLIKAKRGFVMMSGGFSGSPAPGAWREWGFDRRPQIESLLRGGYLAAGDFTNQFVLTDRGRAEVETLPPRFIWAPAAPPTVQ